MKTRTCGKKCKCGHYESEHNAQTFESNPIKDYDLKPMGIPQWEWRQPYTMIQDETTARSAIVKNSSPTNGVFGGLCD